MRALRWAVQAFGELLITLGALLLLFVVWQLWWTDVTANREQATITHQLERDFGAPSKPGQPDPLASLSHVPLGKAFAIIRIPRFGATNARPVLEGTSADILDKGYGHYVGTAEPGAVGNFAVAGHRTTYGRPLHDIDKLRDGDRIVVETKRTYFVYAVQRHVIVTPDHVEVVAAVPQHPGQTPTVRYMTMTSCHPKYSASQRYVVFATLKATYARAAGLPASVMTVTGKVVG